MLPVALLSLAVACAAGPVGPAMFRGRPAEGFLRVPAPAGLSAFPDQWVTQRVDHFDPTDTRTFQQRYWVNGQFWKGTGPVFIFIGGESAGSPGLLSIGTWLMAAEQVGALMLTTEHRFYGKSQPFADLSTPNLKYLSAQQSLADLASLHGYITATYNLTSSTKWISFGGSYSGALSAWFRLKYPHLVVGAVASSAPVLAKLDFVEYLEVVTASLQTAVSGTKCTDAIASATASMQQLLSTSNGQQQLVQQFNLCSAPASALDGENFMSTVASAWMGVVQYNKDNFNGNNITIDVVCDMLLAAPDAVSGYAAVSNLVNHASPTSCLDVSYVDMIAMMKNVSVESPAAGGMRQWTYQTCTEFAYFQSTDGESQVFGSLFPLSFSVQQCVDVFGPLFNQSFIANAVGWTNDYYGATEIAGSEILFPNGSIDPWHALGVLASLPNDETAIFIEGTAHCADVYSPSPNDPPSLTNARKIVIDTLLKWVA